MNKNLFEISEFLRKKNHFPLIRKIKTPILLRIVFLRNFSCVAFHITYIFPAEIRRHMAPSRCQVLKKKFKTRSYHIVIHHYTERELSYTSDSILRMSTVVLKSSNY